MNITNYIKTYTVVAAFSLGSANAASILIQSDDFESLPEGVAPDAAQVQVRGLSLDPNGAGTNANNTYTGTLAVQVNAASGWRDVSSKYNAASGETYNGNARWDQTGNGGGIGIRIRANTGAATLDNAMQLTTLGATSVTMAYDIDLDDDSAYSLDIIYSADAAFTSPVVLQTYTSDGSDNGGWFSDSVTIQDGVGGVVFSDDAYFMIGRTSTSTGFSNPTFHVLDNIVITAEVVPEPSSAALLGLGGLGLLLRRRRA
ncbi:PEP-CTERM sorting domain-containing protein [Verrucomicrobiaceae bacterium R5-34]|uniref:PEP-CTERM sorting domain-containing protein n=1 Tax=Oceaniferula flava TaxID=2800421 RepID=A0AAE2V945_9BACT|nr:PEP-CTERM sorting domain-containing protein [Oceaniferula flavus]MBK1830410.1 PEP-CTERM sorting domain-containing protein [Verrucomicrobiaceae bacterium R5-34]MBK1854503.1 PEP-CTERM sorting domain-containing protein [Oceaniferula flavus]MBM1135809.1 PEP-CTERM sorting domain-containing protein [Oceaniferula flavus]